MYNVHVYKFTGALYWTGVKNRFWQLISPGDRKHYFFSAGLSSGTEDDVILMPNIPMFGAFRKMDNSRFAISVFESLVNSYDGIDKEPFLRLSVQQFLWGYQSIIMTMNKMKNCKDNNKVKSVQGLFML